jgi:serine phosphatase RsbU (regulator of sigma subunit)
MVRDEAIEFVRQLEESVNAHDVERLLGFYADEALTVSPVFTGVVGRVAIRKSWEVLFSLFPDWTVSVNDVLVDGDRLAFMGSASATDRNGWFGQPATGERIEYRTIILLTLVERKIVRDERIYDLASVIQRLEKARIDKELRMAAEVQQVLLSRATRLTPYCEAAGDSIPCRAIGGDFFELVPLPSGDFGIALGDVAGKGPASAILAAMIQGMLAVEARTESSPSAILTRLSQLLFARGLEPRFATMVYGVLSSDGRFVYSNAGHNPPILLTRGGIQRLTTGGPILGAFDNSAFNEETITLSAGDTLIMFSDGVSEATDVHGAEFGEDPLIEYLAATAPNHAPDIVRGILSSVREFCQGAAQSDDITVTATRFCGL